MCIAAGLGVTGLAATLLNVGATATVLGAGVGAYGSVQAGKAAQEQANYQAAVNRNNAVLAEFQAKDAVKRGDIEEKRHRAMVAKMVGSQRAAFASNNVALDSGSPLDVIGDTVQMGEVDALTIRYNAEQEALGFKRQAENYRNSATLAVLGGKADAQAGNIGAFTSVLGGASQLGSIGTAFAPKK